MRVLAFALFLFASLAFAAEGENIWRGDLVDADCKQADSSQPCPVNASTQHFALSADGGVLLYLDAKGDELAAQEIKTTGASGTVAVTIETFPERDVNRRLKVKSVKIAQPVTR